jgi:hypothetical protein
MSRIWWIPLACAVALFTASAGCNNAKACFDQGDEKACNAVCETGKSDAVTASACYEIRARAALACADGKGDCTAPCKNWNDTLSSEDIHKHYVAKLGSAAKVAAMTKACAKK